MIRGCISMIAIIILVGLLFMAGAASISRSFADWRMSANGATAAIQGTEQVRIHETQETERVRIVTDGSVEIARIQADATKKTSLAFSAFWLVRAFLWAVTGLLVLVGVRVIVAR